MLLSGVLVGGSVLFDSQLLARTGVFRLFNCTLSCHVVNFEAAPR